MRQKLGPNYAVFSTTIDPLYSFFVPLVAYCWDYLGINSICFRPFVAGTDMRNPATNNPIYDLINKYKPGSLHMKRIAVPSEYLHATWMQNVRLLAACSEILQDYDMLITSDVDMAVFTDDMLPDDKDNIRVFGVDLVPADQYPMCYIAMKVSNWRRVMSLKSGDYYELHLKELTKDMDVNQQTRGNQWGFDQGLAWSRIIDFIGKNDDVAVEQVKRGTIHGNGQGPALHRMDRDGWSVPEGSAIFDAHLPRPGYEHNNFYKIYSLFNEMFPGEDLRWMIEYRNEFVKRLNLPKGTYSQYKFLNPESLEELENGTENS